MPDVCIEILRNIVNNQLLFGAKYLFSYFKPGVVTIVTVLDITGAARETDSYRNKLGEPWIFNKLHLSLGNFLTRFSIGNIDPTK